MATDQRPLPGRRWVLPAWEGPDSPQSPVPVDEDLDMTPALSGDAWRTAARKAAAAQAKARRNQRGHRPGKPITGIRKAAE